MIAKTEENQLESDLPGSDNLYRMFFMNSLDAVLLTAPDGSILDVNPAACKMFGRTAEELCQVGRGGLMDTADPRLQRVSEEREVSGAFFGELNCIRKDGTKFPVEIASAIYKDAYGETHTSMIIRDITERKAIENALKENQHHLHEMIATKDKMLSIIAHDLRGPFNAIFGFSDLIVSEINQQEYGDVLKYAMIIKQSSQRATNLLNGLLQWSRSQTGHLLFKPEYMDMGALIIEIKELFIDSARQKSIRFVSKLPPDVPVFADKAMISTVLRNLISNAIKYTNAGGEIEISTEQNADELTVSLSDTGIGISNEDMKKLFRLDADFTTNGTQNEKGTGLGLILCKDFIEKHQGKIRVKSELGIGSTFFFTIPGI